MSQQGHLEHIVAEQARVWLGIGRCKQLLIAIIIRGPWYLGLLHFHILQTNQIASRSNPAQPAPGARSVPQVCFFRHQQLRQPDQEQVKQETHLVVGWCAAMGAPILQTALRTLLAHSAGRYRHAVEQTVQLAAVGINAGQLWSQSQLSSGRTSGPAGLGQQLRHQSSWISEVLKEEQEYARQANAKEFPGHGPHIQRDTPEKAIEVRVHCGED